MNTKLNNKNIVISYIEKNLITFDIDLVEALAAGVGPDLFFLPQDLIIRHRDKVFPVPYESFSERNFKNTFVGEAELYLDSKGILAFPFTIDPLVMYYNRDILEGAGIAQPPRFWENFFDIASSITKYDPSLNILQSTIAFGEFQNVAQAKDILSMLLLQFGNEIVVRSGDKFKVVLNDSFNLPQSPAGAVLRFYTEFSNPTTTRGEGVYSWNKSLPNSIDAFTANELAFYFGYASELFVIQQKNPNLNFDVVEIPQIKDSRFKATFGKINALAIAKNSQNLSTAYVVANLLTRQDFIKELSVILSLPPARRDLLSIKPNNPYADIFYNSALISRGWLDPLKEATDIIFKNLVEDIVSGRLSVNESISKADGELWLLLKN